MSKLVVFPRKKKSPKCGDEKDAAKLSSAEQQSTAAAFPLAPVAMKVETKAVTADMKKFNAYAKLRNERVMLRFAGIRAKRVQDKKDSEELLAKK
jgi:large subunit ribosomal protein L13e